MYIFNQLNTILLTPLTFKRIYTYRFGKTTFQITIIKRLLSFSKHNQVLSRVLLFRLLSQIHKVYNIHFGCITCNLFLHICLTRMELFVDKQTHVKLYKLYLFIERQVIKDDRRLFGKAFAFVSIKSIVILVYSITFSFFLWNSHILFLSSQSNFRTFIIYLLHLEEENEL